MTQHELPCASAVRHAVILAPISNADWICPIEWLRTAPDSNQPGLSLLELVSGCVLYSPPRNLPLDAVSTRVTSKDCTVLASTQRLNDLSIFDYTVRKLGDTVRPIDLESSDSVAVDAKMLLLVAHSDREGVLATALRRLEFSNVRAVVLLCCASSHYDLERGPFVDGIAMQILDRMGMPGVVVGSRVPVDINDACRFARSLLNTDDGSRTLAERVTRYLRSCQESGNANPYETPWIVIS